MSEQSLRCWKWTLLFWWCFLCGVVKVISEVDLPPRVLWARDKQDLIIVKDKQSFFSTCTAEGKPTPTIRWKRDGMFLSDQNEFIKAFPNGTLAVEKFSSREDGFYQCIATNSLGTSMSAAIHIVYELRPQGVTDTGGEVTVTATEGDPVILKRMQTPPTIPPYIKRWYKQPNTEELLINDRIGTDSEGNLRFAFVKKEDERYSDTMLYHFGLAPEKAEGSSSIELYNEVKLKVNVGTEGNKEPKLEFYIGNGTVKALVASDAKMDCFFSGKPVATITWRNTSNQVITSGSQRYVIEDFGRRLVIRSLKPEDEGTYSCTGNNGIGDEKSAQIYLNVTSAPMKVPNQGLNSTIQPEGKDVTLWCQARAAPGERIDRPTWYRNGEILREGNLPDPARYSFNADFTQLSIRNVSRAKDTANFQCNVSNSEGYIFYDGFLRVIGAIIISKKPEARNEISPTEVLDMSVIALCDTCYTFKKEWSFKGRILTAEELQQPPFLSEGADILKLNASSVSDSTLSSWLGEYSCRVYSSYDSVIVSFTVVREGEVVPGAAGFDLWWIFIIIAVVLIILIILLIYCCIKTRGPGETYQLEKTEIKHNLNPKQELLDLSFEEI